MEETSGLKILILYKAGVRIISMMIEIHINSIADWTSIPSVLIYKEFWILINIKISWQYSSHRDHYFNSPKEMQIQQKE